MNTVSTIEALKGSNQDFEWYPTTDAMLGVIKASIIEELNYRDDNEVKVSVLDVGAGNGSALNSLTSGDKYAIEKSKVLLNGLNDDIFVVGTDFYEQTLIDKEVSVIFSNPPFSSFVPWATKIIKEANCKIIYLVLPSRWKQSDEISGALKQRKVTAEVLQSDNFVNAQRKARAKIDVIKIDMRYNCGRNGRFDKHLESNPFDLWFKENFPVPEKVKDETANSTNIVEKMEKNQLVKSQGIVHALYTMYCEDMAKVMNTYQKVAEVDADLLKELDVNADSIKKALSLKIKSLKSVYWRHLFDHMDEITERLTSSSREKMLQTLFKHTHIDFTMSNAHAVVVWCIKNANSYFDSQLVDLMESMVTEANVELYKSNIETFDREAWKYNSRYNSHWKPDNLERYKLDKRIVLENKGGIVKSWSKTDLSGVSANFFNDILAIAMNIGFDTRNTVKAHNLLWGANQKQEFLYFNHGLGKDVVLFEARAFLNGNVHLKFNQDFIMSLNVEFGRLKGWLKSHEEASSEVDIPLKDAVKFFNHSIKLGTNNLKLLAA